MVLYYKNLKLIKVMVLESSPRAMPQSAVSYQTSVTIA